MVQPYLIFHKLNSRIHKAYAREPWGNNRMSVLNLIEPVNYHFFAVLTSLVISLYSNRKLNQEAIS
jgi:hypothetical protein